MPIGLPMIVGGDIMASAVESSPLEWPRFCYVPGLQANFSEATGGHPMDAEGRAKTNSLAGQKMHPVAPLARTYKSRKGAAASTGAVRKRKAAVTSMSSLTSSSTKTSKAPRKSSSDNFKASSYPAIPEFAFSNMMRQMASKYNQGLEASSNGKNLHLKDHPDHSDNDRMRPDLQQGSLHPLLFPRRVPEVNNSVNLEAFNAALRQYASSLPLHQAMTSGGHSLFPHPAIAAAAAAGLGPFSALASISSCNSDEGDDDPSLQRGSGSAASDPIDLSATASTSSTSSLSAKSVASSDEEEDGEDNEVDVLSIDPQPSPLQEGGHHPFDVERWNVDTVATFVSNIDTCQEYAQVFRDHCIDGSVLPELSETHMTKIMGLKLGPAFRLRLAFIELLKRSAQSPLPLL